MPRMMIAQNSFTGGEVSPRLSARHDSENTRYHTGLKTLENFLPLIHGPVVKRYGTQYISEVKNSQPAHLFPFVFGDKDAYVVEAGEGYFRFYRHRAPIGSQYDVPTVFNTTQIPFIKATQSRDYRWLVHPQHPPSILQRLSATEFRHVPAPFDPWPSQELPRPGAGAAAISLHPTGRMIVGSIAPDFTPSDVGREVTLQRGGRGKATIVEYINGFQVWVVITEPFTRNNWSPGEWAITKSPNAGLAVSDDGPVGQTVELTLLGLAPGVTNLCPNPSGALGMAYWTNHSRPVVARQTHTGATFPNTLIDINGHFLDAGVMPGHMVYNETDGSNAHVVSVGSQTDLRVDGLGGGGTNDFSTGDIYRIEGTGSAAPALGGFRLIGGLQGVGWIELLIPTAPGSYYRLTFYVQQGPLSCQIGSSMRATDVLAERLFNIGNNHEVIFQAKGSATYIQFRNNQQNAAVVGAVDVRDHTIGGFRAPADVGSYIYARGGIIRIYDVRNAFRAYGVVMSRLDRLGEEIDPNPLIIGKGVWSLQTRIWSPSLGYPGAVALHQGRLFMTGSPEFPLTVCGTAQGDFNYWGISDNPDDGIQRIVDSDYSGVLLWLMSANTLIAGSSFAEFSITGGTNSKLADQSFFVSDPSATGSKDIQPVRTESGSVIFVDRSGLKLYVFGYDPGADRLQPKQLTILAEHLTAPGIRKITYNNSQNILWAVREDDVLLSLSLLMDQGVTAWVRHPMAGTDGVEDIVTIPTPTADETYLLTRRVVGGVTKRFIEVLDEFNGHWGPSTTDCNVVYHGAPTSVITVGHLDGELLSVVADGIILDEQKVIGGQIVLPEPAMLIEAGKPIPGDIEPLKPTVKGSPDAITAVTLLTLVGVFIDLADTLGVKISKDGITIDDELDYHAPGQFMDQPTTLFTGVEAFSVAGSSGDLSEKGSFHLLHTSASPCMVKEIVRVIQIEDPDLD